MDIQSVLKRHAQLVLTILTADALTGADVRSAQEFTRGLTETGGNALQPAPDYIACIANANVDRLNDGYVLALAKELLLDSCSS